MGIEALIGVLGFMGTLLELYQNGATREPIEFTSYSMKRRR
jgi:hypothetical protein